VAVRVLSLMALMAATFLAAPALADTTFTFDPKTTSVAFTATHLGLAHVPGTIPVTKLTMNVGADGLPSSLQAVLDMHGIDTRNADRDADLRSTNWFAADAFPTATFVSTSIAGTDPSHFQILGMLTLHGVTKPIVLDAHLVGQLKDRTGRRRVGYEATTDIDRHAFGVVYASKLLPGGDLIVNTVIPVELEVEAVEASP
jgi:polyisoprenoid-binding protein YceI